MHEPDAATPIEETLSALDDLVRSGKVRYLGNSNFAGWQIADADWTARTAGHTPFISAQNQYSLLHREVEDEVVLEPANGSGSACCRSSRWTVDCSAASTPVGRRRPRAPASRRSVTSAGSTAPTGTPSRRSPRSARSGGHGLLDVAIAGLLAQPAVASVIAGATTPEQVRANAEAGAWRLTSADAVALDQIFAD
nr:hypothetical protein GCM10020092_105460 [Actinoplanes digitatis]